MRILHCLRAPVGGLFRHVLDLAEEQAKRGHDVGILADSRAEDRLTDSKFAAIAPLLTLGIIRTPMRREPGVADLSASQVVRHHAERLAVDVIHGHGAKGGLYARLATLALKRRGRDVRAFYTPHGGSLHHAAGTLQGQLMMAVERGLEHFTSGLIFESGYASRLYRQRTASARVANRVIWNGVQPGDLQPVERNANATDLLFIGELRPVKGVDVLIDAIAALRPERALTATIVGSGAEEAALKKRARVAGVDDLVTFAGALPAREAFKLGRIMVVPSLSESFPYVVLEAAAAGLPLIATSVGGIPEIVEGTDTTLIQPGSVPDLVNAIRHVASDIESALGRAKRLQSAVARRFTVETMTSSVLDFYAAPAVQHAH